MLCAKFGDGANSAIPDNPSKYFLEMVTLDVLNSFS